MIEQAAEQRFGVETGKAHPWDGTVQTDQRRRRSVPDEAEIFQRRITVTHANRPECRIEIKHVASSFAG
ncbi:hypothetical protein ABZ860_34600 [Microbispora sp. NPDC046973]|uniref:hypothetical protein n=1 Tax=Microbispora sp. NPDC046973 TaxID=3155022 RepID=UPI0033E13331